MTLLPSVRRQGPHRSRDRSRLVTTGGRLELALAVLAASNFNYNRNN
jgi:hypothetical protein